MSDAVGVEEVESRRDLEDDTASLPLRESLPLLDVLEKMAAQHPLKHKTELTIILKEIYQV